LERNPGRAEQAKKLVVSALRTRRVRTFLIISVSVVAVDHLVKWVIRSTMHLNQTIEVLGDFFTLSFILNSGIAFGLFDSHPSPYKAPLLIFVSLAALGVILYIFVSLPPDIRLAGVSMGLVFGGAIGNIIDRVVRGEVVDFLDVDFPDIIIPALNIHMTRWPTFNIADSCVLVGIVMLLVIIIRHGARPGGDDAEQEPAA
jgi:signal peptidase II